MNQLKYYIFVLMSIFLTQILYAIDDQPSASVQHVINLIININPDFDIR